MQAEVLFLVKIEDKYNLHMARQSQGLPMPFVLEQLRVRCKTGHGGLPGLGLVQTGRGVKAAQSRECTQRWHVSEALAELGQP